MFMISIKKKKHLGTVYEVVWDKENEKKNN